jgi:hypothetical protein
MQKERMAIHGERFVASRLCNQLGCGRTIDRIGHFVESGIKIAIEQRGYSDLPDFKCAGHEALPFFLMLMGPILGPPGASVKLPALFSIVVNNSETKAP